MSATVTYRPDTKTWIVTVHARGKRTRKPYPTEAKARIESDFGAFDGRSGFIYTSKAISEGDMGFFRKKPVVIEAMQWFAPGWVDDREHKGALAFFEWIGRDAPVESQDERLMVHTLHGPTYAEPGDWVIRGEAGDLWPCKPDIFAATYEPALSPAPTGGEKK